MELEVLLVPLLFSCSYLVIAHGSCHKDRTDISFRIDYDNNQFLKDGKPFRYASGSMHYFRVPRAYWQDRLRKIRALGLNTVCTYIEWSIHEPLPGQFDFTGDNDIEYFIKLAQQEGLLVILRPGPYICSERDLGGYPAWLFTKKPNIFFRSSDTTHKRYVALWYKQLFPRLQPLLYGNGGPVIMLQIENEYGSYIVCDRFYLIWLRDLYRSYVGDKAVLFTTDGNTRNYLGCTIPDVFITVDFRPQKNITAAFAPLREIQPRGPLVNSEFYTGRLAEWGYRPLDNEFGSPISAIMDSTRQMLQLGASFNYYMVCGGTSFGLTSGANVPFWPQVTSYNNYAPISESGNLTEKYFAIQAVLSEFLPIPDVKISASTPIDYGTVMLDPKVSLFDSSTSIPYGVTTHPLTFEFLQQYRGFLFYETVLPPNSQGQRNLSTVEIHDRTIVFLDQKIQGVLSRSYNVTTLQLNIKEGQTLGLLVENQGHLNYKNMTDLKGLVYDVTLDGVVLTTWNHTGYPLTDVSQIPSLPSVSSVTLPGYFSGSFQVPCHQKPQDTFVDMTGWTKGVLFVNGFSLGRYWPVQGRQVTLYCPGTLLKKRNTIVILELEVANPSYTVDLIDRPIFQNVSKPSFIDVENGVSVRNI